MWHARTMLGLPGQLQPWWENALPVGTMWPTGTMSGLLGQYQAGSECIPKEERANQRDMEEFVFRHVSEAICCSVQGAWVRYMMIY